MRSRPLGWVAAATMIGSWACATMRPLPATVVDADQVRFQLSAPEARQAAVAGSFNGWSPTATPMRRDSDGRGRWTATVRLPPGEHQFMYVIDGGEWITPSLAEAYVHDGFGSQNGVVVVRSRATEATP